MIFLDTNILVYAFDKDEKTKNEKAKVILADCWNQQTGTLSTQILQEFYVSLTSKIPNKLSISEAREVIKELLSWTIYEIMPHDIITATEIQDSYNYSFWDSLVISMAQKSGAEVLYSEDMQDGQKIGSLTIVNPLK
jgi:predicted nucleic acid-binding protein